MRVLSLMTLAACFGLFAGQARADRVHLVDGATIEGKARCQGDKVVIELESGLLTLAAGDVTKIERGKSAIERFEELEAKHGARGVAGYMYLADYCREHELPARERAMLEKVLELQPDHAQARARLGFVKSDDGWITREEAAARQRSDTEQAERARRDAEKAKLELEQQRLALERARIELQREQARAEAEAAKAAERPPVQAGYLVYGSPYGYHHHHHGCAPHCRRPAKHRASPFPIAGVRDPRDKSWPIAGVKDPRKR